MKINIEPFEIHARDIKFGDKFLYDGYELTRVRVSQNLLNDKHKECVYVCNDNVLCYFDPETLVKPVAKYSNMPTVDSINTNSFFVLEDKVYMKLGYEKSGGIEVYCFDTESKTNLYRQTLVRPCAIQEMTVR